MKDSNNNYYIKKEYKTNHKIISGEDKIQDSLIFQWEVYKYAQELIRKYNLLNILDIGCGMGMKLKKMILPYCRGITGVDVYSTIKKCRRIHKFGKWYECDIDHDNINLKRNFDIIIAIDVIEHLEYPDKLLSIIKKHSNKYTLIIISTPDRNIHYGFEHNGSSLNKAHVREWNFDEFEKYIRSSNFRIINHFRTDVRTPIKRQHFWETHKLKYCLYKIFRKLQHGKGGCQVIVAKINE